MTYDYGLTQYNDYPTSLLTMDKETLLNYNFISLKSNKNKKLIEYTYIDIVHNQKERFQIKENVFIEDDTVYFQCIIFSNTEKILLKDYLDQKIVFVSCIFLSRIMFIESPKSLTFDSCVFQSVYATNIDSIDRISIQSCIFNELFLRCTEAKEISITLNQINKLSILELKSDSVRFSNNTINKLRVTDYRIDDLYFELEQISCFKKKKIPSIYKIMKILDKKSNSDTDSLLSTLNFINKISIVEHNPIISNKLEYIKSTFFDYGFINNVIMKLFGNFLLPSRTLITACVGIIFFAVVLYLIEKGFVIINSKDFFKYINLSIELFLGATQDNTIKSYAIIRYIERIFGFFSITVFTVSLAKKYVK